MGIDAVTVRLQTQDFELEHCWGIGCALPQEDGLNLCKVILCSKAIHRDG